MLSIWRYISNHLRQDFNGLQYLLIGVFLAGCIYSNYLNNFQRGFLDSQSGFMKFFLRLIFFGTAYYSTVTITCLLKREGQVFRKTSFWIKSILALSLLSLDSSVPFLQGWIDQMFSAQVQNWAYRVSVNLISF